MNLIDFLTENSNTRKIFGEAELTIIEKQLMGIRLTQSEKNRLSRDIRKKFEFIKELSQRSFDFKLKKGSIIRELIEDSKEFILESKYYPRIKKIILYGSTVEGTRTFRSDIDLAIEFDKIDIKEATEFKIKFNQNEKVQVEVYNTLPEKIKKEIDEKGKVIYERENKG